MLLPTPYSGKTFAINQWASTAELHVDIDAFAYSLLWANLTSTTELPVNTDAPAYSLHSASLAINQWISTAELPVDIDAPAYSLHWANLSNQSVNIICWITCGHWCSCQLPVLRKPLQSSVNLYRFTSANIDDPANSLHWANLRNQSVNLYWYSPENMNHPAYSYSR